VDGVPRRGWLRRPGRDGGLLRGDEADGRELGPGGAGEQPAPPGGLLAGGGAAGTPGQVRLQRLGFERLEQSVLVVEQSVLVAVTGEHSE
jgi:hypothetical protein